MYLFDVSGFYFGEGFFTFPLPGHSSSKYMRKCLLEKIALTETDQMYVLWSSRKPFPTELLNRNREETQHRKGEQGLTPQRGSCHATLFSQLSSSWAFRLGCASVQATTHSLQLHAQSKMIHFQRQFLFLMSLLKVLYYQREHLWSSFTYSSVRKVTSNSRLLL